MMIESTRLTAIEAKESKMLIIEKINNNSLISSHNSSQTNSITLTSIKRIE